MRSAPRRRILVVDDHPLMRQSIVESMKRTPDLTVCAEAANVPDAILLLENAHPDVVLTDLSLPDQNGFHFIEYVSGKHPEIPVLVLSMHNEAIHAPRAFRAGAAGYVMKGSGIEQLLLATRRVLDGGIHLSDRVRSDLLRHLGLTDSGESRAPFERLTEAEQVMFEALGRRLTGAELPALTKCTAGELAGRQAEIKRKLRLPNHAAVIHHAILWHEAGGTIRNHD
jgi:DNA-binding NarL/FixJ family response regulator